MATTTIFPSTHQEARALIEDGKHPVWRMTPAKMRDLDIAKVRLALEGIDRYLEVGAILLKQPGKAAKTSKSAIRRLLMDARSTRETLQGIIRKYNEDRRLEAMREHGAMAPDYWLEAGKSVEQAYFIDAKHAPLTKGMTAANMKRAEEDYSSNYIRTGAILYGFWTNGYFAVKFNDKDMEALKAREAKSASKATPPNIPAILPKDRPLNSQEAKVIGVRYGAELTEYLLRNEEGTQTIVNAVYFDTIASRWPKATFYVTGELHPIHFFQDGSCVGLLMPIREPQASKEVVVNQDARCMVG